MRFGARLRVEEQIEPDCEDCGVPALLLQPLVENAVKHGIAGLVEGGAIRLEAQRRGAGVAILLENAFDPESSAGRSLGLGLENVRRRLRVRYGEEAEMEAGPSGDCYRVSLREIRRALLKPKELTRGEPDRCVRKPFPRGEIALAKPSRSHIVSGGQAEGGGGESGAGMVSGWSGGSWRDKDSWRSL